MLDLFNLDLAYSGSYLNLAASASANADDGLFRRCNELLSDGKALVLSLADGRTYSQTGYGQIGADWDSGSPSDRLHQRIVEYDLFKDDFEGSSLHRRGWAVQVN